MRLGTLVAPVASLTACILAGNIVASEKALKKSDLPAAVQKTADEQSKGATIRGYSSEVEGGALQYEVAMVVGGHSREVSIAPDGRVLEIEEEISWNALPAAVRRGLEKLAGGNKITKVESLTKQGKLVAYEAQVDAGDKHSEVQVGPDGNPLAHEE